MSTLRYPFVFQIEVGPTTVAEINGCAIFTPAAVDAEDSRIGDWMLTSIQIEGCELPKAHYLYFPIRAQLLADRPAQRPRVETAVE